MKNEVPLMCKLMVKLAIRRKEDFQEFTGTRMRKFPSDCLAIHKLLSQCKPKVILKMGSCHGGSAINMASYADLIGIESIISVDICEKQRPSHPKLVRCRRFVAAGCGKKIVDLIGSRPCSLILDSNHHVYHVEKELDLYTPFVSPGQALIVEDTMVDVLNFRNFRQTGAQGSAGSGYRCLPRGVGHLLSQRHHCPEKWLERRPHRHCRVKTSDRPFKLDSGHQSFRGSLAQIPVQNPGAQTSEE